MPHRITILPENITNKIAAGEVVERPASVIKELIENSLDAGANNIYIEVSGGGRRLIRIIDNGIGMSHDDALLCLERHATSKIKTAADLDGILTLGFRGEALPSIASICRLNLSSRQKESLEGTEIIVEGGKIRDVKACGIAIGTSITVEGLFFNTPARLKFLKSTETEAGHISDVVTRMAVSRPDIAFTLSVDGRETIKVQKGNLLRRMEQLVGKNASSHLYSLHNVNSDIEIAGFVSSPALVRSSNNALFTYVNGRFVRDKVVQHAIMQAYRGVLDKGRYPVAALFIIIPGNEVDVNVHPTKHEVRFRQQAQVHHAIQSSIEEVLRLSPWLVPQQNIQHGISPSTTSVSPFNQAYKERIAAAAQASLNISKREGFKPSPTGTTPNSKSAAELIHEASPAFTAEAKQSTAVGYFSNLEVIGQFHGEYILCQSNSDLIIIDQHAASERVAFEQLRQQHRHTKVESQHLLFPETMELSHSEVVVAKKFQTELSSIGFDVEPFGGTTLLISSVPRIASHAAVANLMRDILCELQQIGTIGTFKELDDALFSRIACHSVVRGVHQLEQRQIRQLLTNMDNTDFAATCPHGRPVSHSITIHELEKIFKRI